MIPPLLIHKPPILPNLILQNRPLGQKPLPNTPPNPPQRLNLNPQIRPMPLLPAPNPRPHPPNAPHRPPPPAAATRIPARPLQPLVLRQQRGARVGVEVGLSSVEGCGRVGGALDGADGGGGVEG
ncbi:hypothetical protein CDD80_6127 [Ophiocordyceps camponoti-rufipedis]|uniref:Uncharacterized protein n=1 Tax=Ophiocordyceps camponoti-rufipedis TaxID=2004952 RepID=A0A2C5XF94_9HYPO|nr:hypothetical protein CDD80_6127 [Ophiocordyceps camponoti-rufipedis]